MGRRSKKYYLRECRSKIAIDCLGIYHTEYKRSACCPICKDILLSKGFSTKKVVFKMEEVYVEDVHWKTPEVCELKITERKAIKKDGRDIGYNYNEYFVEAKRSDIEFNLEQWKVTQEKNYSEKKQLTDKMKKFGDAPKMLTSEQIKLEENLRALTAYRESNRVGPQLALLNETIEDLDVKIKNRLESLSKAPKRDYSKLSNSDLEFCLQLHKMDIEVFKENRDAVIKKLEELDNHGKK